MEQLRLSEEVFQKRTVPMPDLCNENFFMESIPVKVLFDSGCKWCLVEEFGIDYSHKETFEWIAMIRLPEFVRRKEFD